MATPQSTPSTPKKRKGRSSKNGLRNVFNTPVTVSVSWANLLRDIPQEERNELNLEQLLEETEEASVFTTNSHRAKRLLLESLLCDDELVDRVLQSVGTNLPTQVLQSITMSCMFTSFPFYRSCLWM